MVRRGDATGNHVFAAEGPKPGLPKHWNKAVATTTPLPPDPFRSLEIHGFRPNPARSAATNPRFLLGPRCHGVLAEMSKVVSR